MSKLSSKKIINTINKAIKLNPTTITITQNTKKIVDGALEPGIGTMDITVLIYTGSSETSTNTESNTEGTTYINDKDKMLADKDADLEVNPKKAIEFSTNGLNYKIKTVYPQIVEDTICRYICDLERID